MLRLRYCQGVHKAWQGVLEHFSSSDANADRLSSDGEEVGTQVIHSFHPRHVQWNDILSMTEGMTCKCNFVKSLTSQPMVIRSMHDDFDNRHESHCENARYKQGFNMHRKRSTRTLGMMPLHSLYRKIL